MIDFHTHIFPEKIAKPTLDFLEERCQTKPSTNGMADGLLESTKEAELDLSIILPVVTKPSQFTSINRFASQFQGENKLLSFGGIHPDSDDYKGELKQIKDMGFKGIKLHPDYQGVFIDDIRYKRIIDMASNLDLIVSVHAGFDPGYPDCTHCTPKRSREVIREVQPKNLVLAHMGGFKRWDEVEEYLVGEDVWFDTAVFESVLDEQFMRIIRNHGADKILFATDSPWSDQKTQVKYMESLALTDDEKRMIYQDNACKLLQLS